MKYQHRTVMTKRVIPFVWRQITLSAGLFVLLASLGGLAGCRRGASSAEAAKPDAPEAAPVTVEMATAEIRPMAATVSAQGTLAPGQGAVAHVAATTAGRLVSVLVREGDRVTAGQTVAVVDNRVGQAQARSAASALTVSQAQARQSELSVRALETDQANGVRLALLTLQAALLDRDSAIQQARTALLASQTDLQKTQAGARPQEIAQSEQAVAQALATRDRAASEVQRVQFLNDRGIAPRRQLDDAQTALAVANAALTSAQQQTSLVRAGARAEDLRASELRVQQARETLAQAQASGAAKVAQAQAGLRQARASALQVDARRQEALAAQDTIAQKRADLSAAQTAAQTADLRAPISGVVTRRALNPGDSADTTTPVLEITDTRALNLIASLPAEEGAKVRVGMTGQVVSQDAPGRTFAGRVLSVGQIDPQTNLLAVRVAVANVQGALRAGAFATIDIVTRTNPRAVTVPRQAIVAKEGKPVVFTIGADNVAHQKAVATGAEQGGNVEILTGLNAGERVIRLGQYELADGAKVQEAGKAEKADAGADAKPDAASPDADKNAPKSDAAKSAPKTDAAQTDASPSNPSESAKTGQSQTVKTSVAAGTDKAAKAGAQ